MVAVIKTGHSLHRILNYNENKVQEGVAELIAAANYPMDADQLTFTSKLNMLLRQAALNENVTRNSVHVSLNFDTSESVPKDVMAEIADVYMEGIGFGEQPYLVYQHFDAGHPHIHIVSVKVRSDGSRIDTQNIGRNQSEKARREIEIAYGLKKADGSSHGQPYELKPVNAQKALYGKSGTKKAITNVLDAVLNDYKYASLHELNAVLQLYNVFADRGSEGSRIYQNRGLTFRVLDAQGGKVGVPIKASDFYSKPTLANLEKRFPGNEKQRQAHEARVRNKIDIALLKRPGLKLDDIVNALQKEAIAVVIRQNDDGVIYGLTYVDHKTKCVFNGSALGKKYSAKAVIESCGMAQVDMSGHSKFAAPPFAQYQRAYEDIKTGFKAAAEGKEGIFEILLEPENTFSYIPNGLVKKKRKRKKRNNNRL